MTGKREDISTQATGPRGLTTSRGQKRGEVTREKILIAAGQVFARHQYHAASIRMVASQGRFEHGIIRYHFPSKAELFQTLIRDICKDLSNANAAWLEDVKGMPPRDGLARYVDHVLRYHARKPHALRILVQNLALMENPKSLPGYEFIAEFLTGTRRTFAETLSLEPSNESLHRFQDSFNGLVLYYLGASPCPAQILRLKPTGPKYRAWVKETLVAVFSPFLAEILANT